MKHALYVLYVLYAVCQKAPVRLKPVKKSALAIIELRLFEGISQSVENSTE